MSELQLENQPPASERENTRAAINRANASRSTGPRTEAGKARSSRNALQHGLCVPRVLPGEDVAEFEAFRQLHFEQHAPSDATETMLVEDLVLNYWLLRRARAAEARALAADPDMTDMKRLTLLRRYACSYERAYLKALAVLLKIVRDRKAQELKDRQPARASHFAPDGFVSKAFFNRAIDIMLEAAMAPEGKRPYSIHFTEDGMPELDWRGV